MITNNVIQALYRKYNRRPASVDSLDIHLLFEAVHPSNTIRIDDGMLYINSIPVDSPFHSISLGNIHAIVEFEETVALVMHSTILFLSKVNNDVRVHIKPMRDSLWSRIKDKFSFVA